MRFSTVLFDMDGVLIDSEPAHMKAFDLALNTVGYSLSETGYATYFAGRTDQSGFEAYASAQRATYDIATLLHLKQHIYNKHLTSSLLPYENTITAINHISSTHTLGLVTSSARDEVLRTIHALHLSSAFQLIITADDVRNGKPDPECYNLAMNNLHVSPAQCLVVEDSPNGIRAAKQAGCKVLAITNTHDKSELHLADIIVDSVSNELFDQILGM